MAPSIKRRRLPLVAALAAFVAGGTLMAACGDDGAGEIQLGETDNGRTVSIEKSGRLVVSLPSNPSTGFSWTVAATEPRLLEMQGEPKYVPPKSTPPVVGAAGTQVFTFKAVATGTARLDLIYSRTFEKGVPPEKTFSVTVDVR